MNRIAKILVASSVCLLAAAPVYAGHGGGIGERLERQERRIEQGIRSGELTRREARALKREQRKLRSLVREFREDRLLGKRERRILTRKLDRASDNIYELKHNARDRDSFGHRDRWYDRWDRVRWRDHDDGWRGYGYQW
jgi:hypothetical protein